MFNKFVFRFFMVILGIPIYVMLWPIAFVVALVQDVEFSTVLECPSWLERFKAGE